MKRRRKLMIVALASVLCGLLGYMIARYLQVDVPLWTMLSALMPLTYVGLVVLATAADKDLGIMVGVGLVMYGLVKLTDLLWPGQSTEFLFCIAFIGYFAGGVLYGIAIQIAFIAAPDEKYI